MKLHLTLENFLSEHNQTEEFKGQYLTLLKKENGIELSLTEEGKEKVVEDGISVRSNMFWDYFEDIQVNSEWVYIENLGDHGFGLTEAPGFLYQYDMDDNGEFIENNDSKVYAYLDYQINDPFQIMIDNDSVFFTEIK